MLQVQAAQQLALNTNLTTVAPNITPLSGAFSKSSSGIVFTRCVPFFSTANINVTESRPLSVSVLIFP